MKVLIFIEGKLNRDDCFSIGPLMDSWIHYFKTKIYPGDLYYNQRTYIKRRPAPCVFGNIGDSVAPSCLVLIQHALTRLHK